MTHIGGPAASFGVGLVGHGVQPASCRRTLLKHATANSVQASCVLTLGVIAGVLWCLPEALHRSGPAFMR